MRTKSKLLITMAAVVLVPVLGAAGFWAVVSFQQFPSLEPYRDQYGHKALLQTVANKTPDPDGFSFIVLGDTRSNTYVGEMAFSKAATENADLFFDTGDLIHHGTAKEYIEEHIPLLKLVEPAPVFCVAGNHDRGPYRNFAAYKALYGSERFSFDYGSCRFVGFNASEKIRVTGSELNFLERELSKPGATHKFVFFHIPPLYFEKEIVIGEARRGFEWNAATLRKLLTEQNVTEVFMGHIHGYASVIIDDVRYTLTAGAGAPLSGRLSHEHRLYNYVIVHVTPDGLLREVVYLRDGEWLRKEVQDPK